MIRSPILLAGLAAAWVAGTVSAPAIAQAEHWVPGHWDWSGGRADDRRAYDLHGPGVPILFPELRDNPRGRAFVLRNFDRGHDGFITPREARDANSAFAEAVGPERGGFDWAVADAGPPPVSAEAGRAGRWDHAGMRAYHFRDTPEGARMTLQEDVLFQTDSATLRPHAIDKLQTLAAYLKDNPGVRVAVDGYTDSRGTAEHNQGLSDRRADSVRDAFDQMGVTHARFRVQGHGEKDPVAANTSADGMRLNRRVEVTLLGRHASEFD